MVLRRRFTRASFSAVVGRKLPARARRATKVLKSGQKFVYTSKLDSVRTVSNESEFISRFGTWESTTRSAWVWQCPFCR